MKPKIFVCGGHVTPAIALIDELEKEVEIIFVGRAYAVEYELIREKNIRFLAITAGKMAWPMILKTPIGFIQALYYCAVQKPQVIVSFGGYVAFPIAFAGWLLDIPVITHEQTLAPGRTNRIIAHIAAKVCVAFDEMTHQFPGAIYTGLPIRKELFSSVKKITTPLLYITGGSQGAKSLNEKIAPALLILARSYTIIHQTGSQQSYLQVEKLAQVLQNARIVIGRSGANTTIELAALGKVAILVPLPWSAGDEQLLQGKWLAKNGGAILLEQHKLTIKSLLETIAIIEKNYSSLAARAKTFSSSIARDGAKRLANVVRAFL